jgi:GTP cyclohydrolase II
MTAGTRDGSAKGLAQAGALVSAQHRVERAAGDLRRGIPVFIRSRRQGESAFAAAAETVPDDTLERLGEITHAPGELVLTHARAATLKIRLYTPDVVSLPLATGTRAEKLRAIADPATDLAHPLKGPFEARRDAPGEAAGASVKLAKLAGLLPATVLFRMEDIAGETVAAAAQLSVVDAAEILTFDLTAAERLTLVARASVPLEGAETTEIVSFRPADGGSEHYAIVIGEKSAPALATPGPVLVRLHSECFTGDLLGSLRCDCGDQLRGAVATIADAGGGILLYLAQEGRGIGLMNKLRAYSLQDEGFDTHEANERLGFAADERLYDIAARMLTLLGYRSVRLLTNNPEKIRALETAGIQVVERVPHAFPDNVHNRAYLRAKAERGGHLL